ncbi:MAG: hypothetical protein HOH74_12765 [Gemmatimonadetes bacterium]|nr:hypothetical protein [Gemmatimonadota bacterium]MBT6146301.1 hypothetical protein [Gemmatimonadota bacterium]
MRLTRLLCISAILLTSGSAWAAPFDCGPFLLQPGTNTMTIVIDHAEPVEVTMTWRRADGGEKRTVARAADRHHIFTLDDLEPDTRYQYRLKGSGFDSDKREFRTLPEAPAAYRFITLGDVRSLPDVWHKVSQRIHENEPEALFIVGTGDYPADGSQYSQWKDQFFSPARDLLARVPMWPSIGNHERTRQFITIPPTAEQEEQSHYFSLFELPGNEHWYRVDYQYVTLLIIDSNSQMQPGYEQYEWLREQLRSPRERFTIAAFHHAPLTSGPHGRRHEDGTPREWPIDQTWRFVMPLFEMYGVDLVLNGHDHLYERSVKDGVTYVVTGGGGAPLYKIDSVENPYQQVAVSTNHYLTVDVSASRLEMTAIDVEGEVLDHFEVPVGPNTKRRMNGSWLQQLMGTIEFEHQEGRSRAQVENVLDFEVDVELTVEGAATKKMMIPSGHEASAWIDVVASDKELSQPAWRGRIALPMEMRLSGEGDGIPFETTVSSQAVLREAAYNVALMPTPEIDGDLGDWPGDGGMQIDSASRTIVSPSHYAGDEDMTARVQAGWSAAGLHLCFRIDDDDVVEVPGASAWQVDGVEIYVDGRAEDRRTASYDESVSQNVLPAGRPDEPVVGTNSWDGGFTWAAKHRDGGYDLEVTFPYARIRNQPGAVPAVGDRVRFDVMINDLDTQGGISHHRLWSTGGASSDPSGFGVLVLTD